MNAVELTDLTKHYGDFTLDRVSLSLPEGCVMGLVGENGAGKTTLIKLLLGMLRRDGGAVRVLGRDMDTDSRAVKEELGVVLDEAGFPECVTARQAGRIMAAAYRNWDARAYDENLQKLSLPEDKPFKDFSRGMKMKLSLAVALSHNARLLVLDEALNGIDPVALSLIHICNSKSGHGVYERRTPFVHFCFKSVEGAMKVLQKQVEFVKAVELGYVETIGSPEYACYLNDYMAILQGMLT